MANENASFIDRLKTLFTTNSGKESQGKAGKDTLTVTYGESVIKESFRKWRTQKGIGKFLQEYQETYSVQSNSVFTCNANTNDCVAEVFMTNSAGIKTPYTLGVAYELCKLERWYAPDCRPGIISWIIQPNDRCGEAQVYANRKPLIVLFAEDQYIELQPNQREITNPKLLQLCKLHFAERGFDFLDENQTLMFDLFDRVYDADGQAEKEIDIRSNWSYRGSMSNSQITAGGRTSNIGNRSIAKIPQVSNQPTVWGSNAEWHVSETIETITK